MLSQPAGRAEIPSETKDPGGSPMRATTGTSGGNQPPRRSFCPARPADTSPDVWCSRRRVTHAGTTLAISWVEGWKVRAIEAKARQGYAEAQRWLEQGAIKARGELEYEWGGSEQ